MKSIDRTPVPSPEAPRKPSKPSLRRGVALPNPPFPMLSPERNTTFERVFERHFEEIRRFVEIRTQNTLESYDVAQEAMIRLWLECHSPDFKAIDDEFKVRSWLYTTANRIMIDEKRRQKKSTSLERLVEEDTPYAKSRVGELPTTLETQEALRSLDSGEQLLIALSYQGYSYTEVATLFGITPGNAAVRITRAKKALQKALGK